MHHGQTDTRVRILHLTWRLSKAGGIPIVVRELIRRMDRTRFDVHVATVRPRLEEDELDELEPLASLHPIGVTGEVTHVDRIRIATRFARLARRLRPHLVHTHSGTAWYTLPYALASLRRGPAQVLEYHDAPARGRHGQVTERLEGLMTKRLGHVPLVHSTSVRDDVVGVHGVAPSTVELVPLGIDTARFGRPDLTSAAWRAAHGVPEGGPLVLYVARLVATKNLPLYIEVARLVSSRMPGAVFVVVAGGAMRPELERAVIARGLEGTVRFVGPRFGTDLVDAYHACDVFLSTSDYEGFGLAVAEAMASGRPVVATAAGGVTDLVDDGVTGALAAVGDADGLAAAVMRFLEDDDLRRRAGAAGRTRARELFDIDRTVAGIEDLYGRLAVRAASR